MRPSRILSLSRRLLNACVMNGNENESREGVGEGGEEGRRFLICFVEVARDTKEENLRKERR